MQHTEKKQIVLGLIGVAFLVILFYFRKQILSVLTVFALAAGFTVILSPVCRRLEDQGICPCIASLISVLLFVVLAAFTIGVLIPYIAAQLLDFAKKNMPVFVPYFTQVGARFERLGFDAIQWTHLTEILTENISGLLMSIAQAGITITASIGKFAIASVMAYYSLCDRKKIGRQLLLLIPLSYRSSFMTVMNSARNAFMGYLSGLIKTSLFVFAATYAGLLLLRIPDAFILSLLMALLETLPYIGPFFAALPILLSAASSGIVKMIYALILIVAIQQIEGSFAGPYFTASSTSVHPLAAFSGVFVFGTFFGIGGILLAVPVLTIAQSMIWSIVQLRANRQT